MDKIKELKEKLMSREQAANALDCHVNTIDRLLKNGTIKAVKLGKKVLIKAESIEEALRGVSNE